MRITIVCSPTLVTGGPEALHQFAHKANGLGHDARIYYFPDVPGPVAEAYRGYQVPATTQIIDAPGTMVLVPEIWPYILPRISFATRALWWLSVDNAVLVDEQRQALGDPATTFSLQDSFKPAYEIVHLAQSEYARRYVAGHGAPARMLSDYLTPEFLARAAQLSQTPKLDRVAYNPKKGIDFTRQLIAASPPGVEWVPIQGMTPTQVAELLASSKVYVDFGEHPGRDRIPREAAVAGCVVITGSRGAAGNGIDIPIPAEFVFDETQPLVVQRVLDQITAVTADYPAFHAAFAGYREWIGTNEQTFTDEVAALLAPRPPRSRPASLRQAPHTAAQHTAHAPHARQGRRKKSGRR
jgi:hypothetical protein